MEIASPSPRSRSRPTMMRWAGAGIVVACALPLAVQAQTLRQAPPPVVRTTPLVTKSPVPLLPPNITRWGVVERQGGQGYGKTGQTIFIEGRDLIPDALVLELRDGTRAVPFPRRPGGSSARVEFTIPTQAITGDLTYPLQAVQGGTRVLATDFGVCDRVNISAITPNEILLDQRSANVHAEYSVRGKMVTLAGGCLDEVVFARSKNRNALLLGTPGGALTISREVSRSFGRIVLELSNYVPGSPSGIESRGPIKLVTPQEGPAMTVATRSQVTPAPAPAPEALSVIRIDRFESQQTWGGPGAAKVPFVVTQTDTEDLASQNRPVRWNNSVRISGENLAANTGTQWRIGEVLIGRANESIPPDVSVVIPANAVSSPLCAVRRDGARFCSKLAVPVVAGPKIVQAATGWPRNGTVALGENFLVTAKVRQVHAITGFDLVPKGDPNLSAELVVANYDEAPARACNLDFKVLRMDASRIEFSFGTPGTTRPSNCAEGQEAQVNFMRPGSGPVAAGVKQTLPGRVRLSLNWVYQGRREGIATWNVHGNL